MLLFESCAMKSDSRPQVVLTGLSAAVTCSSATSLRLKQGLPPVNQAAGWTVLGDSISERVARAIC